MNIFSELNEILFPSRCISCKRLGIALCSQCRRQWNPHLYRTVITHGAHNKLSVTSSLLYSPVIQRVLLAAKESDIEIADQLVSEAIAHSIGNILRNQGVDTLIPIPSRRGAARKRGRQFIFEMVEPTARQMGLKISSPITYQRSVRDQTGLHVAQRWNNLHGAFVIERSEGEGERALLVDDLVTTGATLLEAARAARYAGFTVIGAVTAAVAQPVRLRE